MPHCPSCVTGSEHIGSTNTFVSWWPVHPSDIVLTSLLIYVTEQPRLIINSLTTLNITCYNSRERRMMTKTLRDVGEREGCLLLLSLLCSHCQQPNDKSFICFSNKLSAKELFVPGGFMALKAVIGTYLLWHRMRQHNKFLWVWRICLFLRLN